MYFYYIGCVLHSQYFFTTSKTINNTDLKNGVQHWVWQYWGRPFLPCTSTTWQQQFGLDVFQMPHHRQAQTVVRHPKQYPAKIQTNMTLPTRPNAIFSTLQGTRNPDTKPTLQRAKNATTQPTHPSIRISIIICSAL
jgi:hypothetical protein